MSKKAKKKESEYAQNLSHELMTPLAIIRSKAEILMQSANLNGDELHNLDVILKNVIRMNSLNKSLILLSKIEEKVYVDREIIDLKELTNEILENFEDQIQTKQLKVKFNAAKDSQINSNKTLLDILITNLIKNAVVHNIKNGLIQINLNENTLTVTNTFNEKKPPPYQHLKRFTTSKSEEGSIGLGLSIVKRISKYLSFVLEIDYSKNEYKSIIKFS